MKMVIVEEGTRSALSFESKVVRIGRAIDNDIRLASAVASRHHCRIEIDERGAWAIDLGSANGTLVNGRRIERKLLAQGDVLGIGGARITLEAEPDLGAHLGDTQELSGDVAGVEPGALEPEGTDFASGGLRTLAGESQKEQDNVRVFARITRALTQETELLPLLKLIVDSAVALVGGERGFLLLASAGETKSVLDPAEMKVRVARTFDRADIPVPASRLSMGIARRVAEKNRPLLSIDAAQDERFSGMASVEDLKLRSVMCLPIAVDGRVEGVLYVDNRLQRGVFSEDALDQVELLAGQAAIGIKNARLLAELRERNQRLAQSAEQIRHLNQQLGRKVRDQGSELAVVRAELSRERGRYDYGEIVGASDAMRRVFQELDRLIDTELPVLILGESGTGKELIARAIHFNGPRREKPFVGENCAALPDTLLESELFGHTRGAFTGADRAKKGLIEQAHGGTLFLDEIGDMTTEMQKKLLRVLQEGEVRPLGSNQQVKVDVRLLAASHKDLEQMVARGEFREDLYYRVNVVTLRLPALRERREDVPLLAQALLARSAREAGRSAPAFSHEVQAALSAYDWPGNVRELENEMRRLLLVAGEVVMLEHLSSRVLEGGAQRGTQGAEPAPFVVGDLRAAVTRFEKRAIEEALAAAAGNKSRAASALGISRFALQRKLFKYDLARGDDLEGLEADVQPATQSVPDEVPAEEE